MCLATFVVLPAGQSRLQESLLGKPASHKHYCLCLHKVNGELPKGMTLSVRLGSRLCPGETQTVSIASPTSPGRQIKAAWGWALQQARTQPCPPPASVGLMMLAPHWHFQSPARVLGHASLDFRGFSSPTPFLKQGHPQQVT